MEQLEQQVVASVDGQLQTPVMTHTGQVKWFNNKLCYGFIRVVSEGDSHGEDIFVHQIVFHTLTQSNCFPCS